MYLRWWIISLISSAYSQFQLQIITEKRHWRVLVDAVIRGWMSGFLSSLGSHVGACNQRCGGESSGNDVWQQRYKQRLSNSLGTQWVNTSHAAKDAQQHFWERKNCVLSTYHGALQTVTWCLFTFRLKGQTPCEPQHNGQPEGAEAHRKSLQVSITACSFRCPDCSGMPRLWLQSHANPVEQGRNTNHCQPRLNHLDG